jgi:hypothetical protein
MQEVHPHLLVLRALFGREDLHDLRVGRVDLGANARAHAAPHRVDVLAVAIENRFDLFALFVRQIEAAVETVDHRVQRERRDVLAMLAEQMMHGRAADESRAERQDQQHHRNQRRLSR